MRSFFEIFPLVKEKNGLTQFRLHRHVVIGTTPDGYRFDARASPSGPSESAAGRKRLFRKRASKKAWKERNYEYVILQLAEIQRRPESRARRAALDQLRWLARKAAKNVAKCKNGQCVHSSDQFFISSEIKTPITT
jgi:hypothetical protein